MSIGLVTSASGTVHRPMRLSASTGPPDLEGELHAIAGRPAQMARNPRRAREDLERSDGVERLQAREQHDDHVALPHHCQRASPATWRQ